MEKKLRKYTIKALLDFHTVMSRKYETRTSTSEKVLNGKAGKNLKEKYIFLK